MPDITNDELTIAETCALLDCSRWTLMRLISAYRLDVKRVKGPGRDGAKRIPRSSLVALVRKCTIAKDLGGPDVATAIDEEPDLDLETLEAFSARTGISKRVLDEMARKRGFTNIKVGRTRFLNRAMRREFLEAHTQSSQAQADQSAEEAQLQEVRDRVNAQRARKSRNGASR